MKISRKISKFSLSLGINQFPWNLNKMIRFKKRKWAKIKFSQNFFLVKKKNNRSFNFKLFNSYKKKTQKLLKRYFASNLTFRQYKKLFKSNYRYKATYKQILKSEYRLDTLVFRLYMLPDISVARELIKKNFFLLNNKEINLPKIVLTFGDIISSSNKNSWKFLYNHMLIIIASLKKYFSRIFFKFSFPFVLKRKEYKLREFGKAKERIIKLVYNRISNRVSRRLLFFRYKKLKPQITSKIKPSKKYLFKPVKEEVKSKRLNNYYLKKIKTNTEFQITKFKNFKYKKQRHQIALLHRLHLLNTKYVKKNKKLLNKNKKVLKKRKQLRKKVINNLLQKLKQKRSFFNRKLFLKKKNLQKLKKNIKNSLKKTMNSIKRSSKMILIKKYLKNLKGKNNLDLEKFNLIKLNFFKSKFKFLKKKFSQNHFFFLTKKKEKLKINPKIYFNINKNCSSLFLKKKTRFLKILLLNKKNFLLIKEKNKQQTIRKKKIKSLFYWQNKRITKKHILVFNYLKKFNNKYKQYQFYKKLKQVNWTSKNSFWQKTNMLFDKKKKKILSFNSKKSLLFLKKEIKNVFFFKHLNTKHLRIKKNFKIEKKILRIKQKYLRIKGFCRKYQNLQICVHLNNKNSLYNPIKIKYKKINLLSKHRPFAFYFAEVNYNNLEFTLIGDVDFLYFPYKTALNFKMLSFIDK
jgi:ribosomal protein S4